MTTTPQPASMSSASGRAHLEATLSKLQEIYTDLAKLLLAIDDDEANWHPPAEDTNSIAAMVRHMVGATALWLGRAAGEEIERDRDAEFRASDTAANLAAAVDGAVETARQRFAQLANVDPATVRRVNFRGGPGDLSAAGCLARARAHVGEHWGQVQLTHQWYAVRGAS